MKRVLLTIGLCVAVTAALAQKKAVSEAERISKDAKPDFKEARTQIKGALENPETMNEAKTWYVAAKVEDTQFNSESTKQVLGQQPNEPVMYEALRNSLPYFLKAYELDQLPNEKGKIKPKYAKDIKSTLAANHAYYVNAGAYYFERQDYKNACAFFDQYLEISNLPFFAGEKVAARDSQYMIVQFYSAISATQLGDSDFSIKGLMRAKDAPYRQFEVYQYLYTEYELKKDTANMIQILKEGFNLFPDSSVFILHLINRYIQTDQNEDAIELLKTAIAKDPNNPDLYQAMGTVYENGKKSNTDAEIYFVKALELQPENPTALFNLGRIYYNQGVNKLGEANLISDAKKYAEEKAIAKDFFQKALPYIRKAYEKEPESREHMNALRSIYYQLDMGKEFDEIDAKMGGQ
jgi:tetratricopeptide (TPR) repeat protein